MAHWLVELTGDRFDLEEFPFWFPHGEVYAVQEDEGYYLTGELFDGLADPVAIHTAAFQLVDEFSAAIRLIWPSLKRPEVGAVIEVAENGSRRAHQFLSASVSRGRSKARGKLQRGEAREPQKTQAQTLVTGMRSNAHLRIAALLWADSFPSWSRLYRILEEIEQYLGEKVDKAGLTSAAQRERFARSANTAEIAGSDSRHAQGKFELPSDPMSIGEASDFVGQQLHAALRRAAAGLS